MLTRTSKLMAWIAGTALTAMVLIVVVDVVARRLGLVVLGGIELSVLALVLLGFFALPWSVLAGSHIMVEVVTAGLPRTFRHLLDRFWLAVLALVFVTLAWLTIIAGVDLNATGQTTEIIRIPPLLPYGAAAIGLIATAIVAAKLALFANITPYGAEQTVPDNLGGKNDEMQTDNAGGDVPVREHGKRG